MAPHFNIQLCGSQQVIMKFVLQTEKKKQEKGVLKWKKPVKCESTCAFRVFLPIMFFVYLIRIYQKNRISFMLFEKRDS